MKVKLDIKTEDIKRLLIRNNLRVDKECPFCETTNSIAIADEHLSSSGAFEYPDLGQNLIHTCSNCELEFPFGKIKSAKITIEII